jgi:hypothetical protein
VKQQAAIPFAGHLLFAVRVGVGEAGVEDVEAVVAEQGEDVLVKAADAGGRGLVARSDLTQCKQTGRAPLSTNFLF